MSVALIAKRKGSSYCYRGYWHCSTSIAITGSMGWQWRRESKICLQKYSRDGSNGRGDSRREEEYSISISGDDAVDPRKS